MNRRGMTLLELIVALTITGAALSAGYGAFATLVDRRERAAENTAATLREFAARESLIRWIASARLTSEEDEIQFRAIDGMTRDRHPDDDIVFFTTAATPASIHGTIVRLYIDRDAKTPETGLVADLRDWKGTRRETLILMPRAAGLDGRFLSGIFGSRQWLESWVSTSVLPAGARISVTAAENEPLPPLWRQPMSISIEGGR